MGLVTGSCPRPGFAPLLSTARVARAPGRFPVHRFRVLIVALIALALSFTGLSAASATTGYGPRPPEIKSLGAYAAVDHNNREVVSVRGTYRCWGPSYSMHLWVSVKQGGPNPRAEGSSTTVKAWYDTNISQDVAVKCDGVWHTKTVKLGRHPVANYPTDDPETTPPTRPLGYLKNGPAWLQFCLVPPAQDQIFASKSRWVTVTGAGYYGVPA